MLFQVALATLDANRNKLLAVQDDGEAMTILGNYLEHVTNRDSTMPTSNQGISNRNIGVPSTGVWLRGVGRVLVKLESCDHFWDSSCRDRCLLLWFR